MAVGKNNSDKDEDAEQRLQRVIDRLFSTSAPVQAASSSSPPAKTSNVGTTDWHRLGSLSPFVLSSGSAEKKPAPGPTSIAPSSQPWDRGDLLKRLATFKSISWFGKPSAAGPVACARRGWVNVGLDMISCEACGSRLSFPIPDHWSKQQVEKAALKFSEQLDGAHKPLCPWKGNACTEELAQFPPTPVPALIQGYNQRLESLSELSALPVLSASAIEHMNLSRGPQIQYLLSPAVEDSLMENLDEAQGEAVQKMHKQYESYCQAQKLISLCGWELRYLSYAVDSDDHMAPSGLKRKAQDSQDCGPKVSLCVDKSKEVATNCGSTDPASVVLDCSLCGASVGLWSFTTLNRSSLSLSAILGSLQASTRKDVETPISVINETPAEEHNDTGTPEGNQKISEGSEDTSKHQQQEIPRRSAGLDLCLTIAGGPRPTLLPYPPGVSPAYIPFPGLFKKHVCESRKPSYPNTEQESTEQPNCSSFRGDAEGEARSHVGSTKRQRIEKTDDDDFTGLGHRKKLATPRAKGEAQGMAGCSSVNAVETSYQNKHENSAESVECSPQESDGQETVLSRENNENGAQAQEGISSVQVIDNQGHTGDSAMVCEQKDTSGVCLDNQSSGGQFKEPVVFSGVTAGEFDPIHQHRYFCPWVTASVEKDMGSAASCGWQLTLDALYAMRFQKPGNAGKAESEGNVSAGNVDALSSVRKLLSGKATSKPLEVELKKSRMKSIED